MPFFITRASLLMLAWVSFYKNGNTKTHKKKNKKLIVKALVEMNTRIESESQSYCFLAGDHFRCLVAWKIREKIKKKYKKYKWGYGVRCSFELTVTWVLLRTQRVIFRYLPWGLALLYFEKIYTYIDISPLDVYDR